MSFPSTIEKLLTTIKDEGSVDTIMIETLEDCPKYPATDEGVKKALEYATAVDDVVGVRSMKGSKSVGWFGIEPSNTYPLDIIYDYYSENDLYCKYIMAHFKH